MIEGLEHLKKHRPKRATLYFSSPEKVMLNIGGDLNTSFFAPRSETQKRYKEIAESFDS